MRQLPKARHDDGKQAVIEQQTVMREYFCKTTERGLGQLHAIVSAFNCSILRTLFVLRFLFAKYLGKIKATFFS